MWNWCRLIPKAKIASYWNLESTLLRCWQQQSANQRRWSGPQQFIIYHIYISIDILIWYIVCMVEFIYKPYAYIVCIYCMHILHAYIVCIYCMHILYAYIVCIYCMHILYAYIVCIYCTVGIYVYNIYVEHMYACMYIYIHTYELPLSFDKSGDHPQTIFKHT